MRGSLHTEHEFAAQSLAEGSATRVEGVQPVFVCTMILQAWHILCHALSKLKIWEYHHSNVIGRHAVTLRRFVRVLENRFGSG